MAVQAQVWQPFAHPVHRLIQTLDTSVAALWSYGIRVRRLEYRFDGGQPAFANSEIYDQFHDIANGYEKVTTELFVRSKAGPMEVARQLENDCISHFISHGDTTASPAVISACALVRSVPMYLPKEELQKGYPHSWPSRQLYNDAESIRETIFRHLSRIGQAVPHIIDERISRRLSCALFNDEEPPTLDELISWAKETHSTGIQETADKIVTPPAVDAGKPTAERVPLVVAASEAAKPPRDGRGKNIDAKMLKIMAELARSHSWTIREWAECLGCSRSTVGESKTWKERLSKLKILNAIDSRDKMDKSRTNPKGKRKPKHVSDD